MKYLKEFIHLFVIVVLFTGLIQAQADQAKKIQSITFRAEQNQLTVSVSLQGNIAYESYTIPNPNRLILDFKDVSDVTAEPLVEVNDFGVSAIRTARFDATTTRVVFDLAETMPFFKIEETDTGLDIIFTTEMKEQEEAEPEVAEERKLEEKPEQKPPTPVTESVPVSAGTGMKNASIGLTAGFYFPQDEVFEEIYGKSFFSIGGEYAFVLPLENVNSVDVCLGFKHMSKTGMTSFLEEELKLRMLHFSLSVRYVAEVQNFRPFIGPGIDYIVYKETYPEDFPFESLEGSTVGFHIYGGTYYDFTPSLAAKVGLKYNIANTTKNDIEINLGGVEWTVGLVFRFGL